MNTIENLKEALSKATEPTDIITTQFQVAKDVTINVYELEHNEWDEPEEFEALSFDIHIKFHGEWYRAVLNKKRILEDEPIFAYIESIDEGNLMSSMEEAIEEKFWDHIKLICLRLEELEKEDINS